MNTINNLIKEINHIIKHISSNSDKNENKKND